jgi:hypothetical protein
LFQGFNHVTLVGLCDDALWGERALSIGGAERTMRHPLLVQAYCDDDIIEHALLPYTVQSAPPWRRRAETVFGLVPAFKTAVGPMTVSSRSFMTGPLVLTTRPR